MGIREREREKKMRHSDRGKRFLKINSGSSVACGLCAKCIPFEQREVRGSGLTRKEARRQDHLPPPTASGSEFFLLPFTPNRMSAAKNHPGRHTAAFLLLWRLIKANDLSLGRRKGITNAPPFGGEYRGCPGDERARAH
ncbi:hypothetical protein CEXT_373061 [Caerostris extrusa]|uniref:Uncharacterized protein n=1 Tax=Caerostris extrusa TaxID=172846 RepID=A0AAV4UBE0_CAEEX|nr:hypothetical protein CEXT_373061 [Caerostris extrusa]